MNISLKEAAETKYWLRLLAATDYLTDDELNLALNACIEPEKTLYNIVRTSKKRLIKTSNLISCSLQPATVEKMSFEFAIKNSEFI
ncbi:MAG: four helix bundle protein [Acutalibacteraceae bacterium]